jgi:hypothetical protein
LIRSSSRTATIRSDIRRSAARGVDATGPLLAGVTANASPGAACSPTLHAGSLSVERTWKSRVYIVEWKHGPICSRQTAEDASGLVGAALVEGKVTRRPVPGDQWQDFFDGGG